MDITIIIISLVIGVIGSIAGGFYWVKFKDIVKQVLVLFDVFIKAIEDDTITREELDLIVKEAKLLFSLFKTGKVEDIEEKVKSLSKKKK